MCSCLPGILGGARLSGLHGTLLGVGLSLCCWSAVDKGWEFGASLRLAAQAKYAIIGAPVADQGLVSQALRAVGGAYVWTRIGKEFVRNAQGCLVPVACDECDNCFGEPLVPLDPESGWEFGSTVDIDDTGTYAVVGAKLGKAATASVRGSGSVHVFYRVRGSTDSDYWQQIQVLESTHPVPDDKFGFPGLQMSANAEIIAVSEWDCCENKAWSGITKAQNTGAVYVYVRDTELGNGLSSRWNHSQTLTFPESPQAKQRFGSALAIDRVNGHWLAVGAEGEGSFSGTVSIFKRQNTGSGTTFAFVKTLSNPATKDPGFDLFGSALDLDCTLNGRCLLAVGARGLQEYRGAVYVFEHAEGALDDSWQLMTYASRPGFIAPCTSTQGCAVGAWESGNNFGNAVALSAGLLYVGAYSSDPFRRQSTWMYAYSQGEWTESSPPQTKPRDSSAGLFVDLDADANYGKYGKAVDLAGQYRLAGSPDDGATTDPVSAGYAFLEFNDARVCNGYGDWDAAAEICICQEGYVSASCNECDQANGWWGTPSRTGIGNECKVCSGAGRFDPSLSSLGGCICDEGYAVAPSGRPCYICQEPEYYEVRSGTCAGVLTVQVSPEFGAQLEDKFTATAVGIDVAKDLELPANERRLTYVYRLKVDADGNENSKEVSSDRVVSECDERISSCFYPYGLPAGSGLHIFNITTYLDGAEHTTAEAFFRVTAGDGVGADQLLGNFGTDGGTRSTLQGMQNSLRLMESLSYADLPLEDRRKVRESIVQKIQTDLPLDTIAELCGNELPSTAFPLPLSPFPETSEPTVMPVQEFTVSAFSSFVPSPLLTPGDTPVATPFPSLPPSLYPSPMLTRFASPAMTPHPTHGPAPTATVLPTRPPNDALVRTPAVTPTTALPGPVVDDECWSNETRSLLMATLAGLALPAELKQSTAIEVSSIAQKALSGIHLQPQGISVDDISWYLNITTRVGEALHPISAANTQYPEVGQPVAQTSYHSFADALAMQTEAASASAAFLLSRPTVACTDTTTKCADGQGSVQVLEGIQHFIPLSEPVSTYLGPDMFASFQMVARVATPGALQIFCPSASPEKTCTDMSNMQAVQGDGFGWSVDIPSSALPFLNSEAMVAVIVVQDMNPDISLPSKPGIALSPVIRVLPFFGNGSLAIGSEGIGNVTVSLLFTPGLSPDAESCAVHSIWTHQTFADSNWTRTLVQDPETDQWAEPLEKYPVECGRRARLYGTGPAVRGKMATANKVYQAVSVTSPFYEATAVFVEMQQRPAWPDLPPQEDKSGWVELIWLPILMYGGYALACIAGQLWDARQDAHSVLRGRTLFNIKARHPIFTHVFIGPFSRLPHELYNTAARVHMLFLGLVICIMLEFVLVQFSADSNLRSAPDSAFLYPVVTAGDVVAMGIAAGVLACIPMAMFYMVMRIGQSPCRLLHLPVKSWSAGAKTSSDEAMLVKWFDQVEMKVAQQHKKAALDTARDISVGDDGLLEEEVGVVNPYSSVMAQTHTQVATTKLKAAKVNFSYMNDSMMRKESIMQSQGSTSTYNYSATQIFRLPTGRMKPMPVPSKSVLHAVGPAEGADPGGIVQAELTGLSGHSDGDEELDKAGGLSNPPGSRLHRIMLLVGLCSVFTFATALFAIWVAVTPDDLPHALMVAVTVAWWYAIAVIIANNVAVIVPVGMAVAWVIAFDWYVFLGIYQGGQGAFVTALFMSFTTLAIAMGLAILTLIHRPLRRPFSTALHRPYFISLAFVTLHSTALACFIGFALPDDPASVCGLVSAPITSGVPSIQSLQLSCPTGKTITTIVAAVFGAVNSTCADPVQDIVVEPRCSSSAATSVVSSICLGLDSCKVLTNASLFFPGGYGNARESSGCPDEDGEDVQLMVHASCWYDPDTPDCFWVSVRIRILFLVCFGLFLAGSLWIIGVRAFKEPEVIPSVVPDWTPNLGLAGASASHLAAWTVVAQICGRCESEPLLQEFSTLVLGVVVGVVFMGLADLIRILLVWVWRYHRNGCASAAVGLLPFVGPGLRLLFALPSKS
eukprot:gene6829-163_t